LEREQVLKDHVDKLGVVKSIQYAPEVGEYRNRRATIRI
jgi:hypothetical protein